MFHDHRVGPFKATPPNSSKSLSLVVSPCNQSCCLQFGIREFDDQRNVPSLDRRYEIPSKLLSCLDSRHEVPENTE